MSKIAKVIGQVASVVAFVAGVALLFVPGGQVFGVGLMTISGIASAVAAVAMAVSQATMKPPDVKGSVNQVVIGKNMAIPLLLGLTYTGGLMIYDKTGNGQENYTRSQIMVVSSAGPIESFQSFNADFNPITVSGGGSGLFGPGDAAGYYNGYMWAASKKGARPETAFTAISDRPALSEWGSAYKLSGHAAYMVSMEFDEKGKRYSSGVPQFGVIAKGIKVYDPRKDSTYPGGSGSHRWNDEATFEWSENPALHALTYARGRYIEKDAAGVALTSPVKIAGCGFPFEGIRVSQYVELANLCEANGWTVGGTIYEGPGTSKWDNLKRILQTCAAEPLWSGGQLGVKFSAPRTSLGTITSADLADGDISIQAMKTYRDKINTVVPRVRLADQRWEYTQIDAVTSSVYSVEDGEVKTKEVQYDLVQDKDQGAELAAYDLVNSREFGPITLPLKPKFMVFRLGEALTIDLPEGGLNNQLAIITGRQIDPQTGSVILTFESETTAKHSFALGRTGVAPPSPTLLSSEERDNATSALTVQQISELINTSSVIDPDPTTALLIASENTITIEDHTRRYSDFTVSVEAGSRYIAQDGFAILREDGGRIFTEAGTADITGLTAATLYHLYYDDFARVGGVVSVEASTSLEMATNKPSTPGRHYLGSIKTAAVGAPPNTGGGAAPPGVTVDYTGA